MLWSRSIQKCSPEKIFLLARNATDVTMTVGRGACWHFYRAGGAAYGDWDWNGCDVTMHTFISGSNRSEVSSHYPLAGVVSPKPIPPGAWGLIQAYGYVDRMAFAATTNDWLEVTTYAYAGGNRNWIPHYYQDFWTLGSGVFALKFPRNVDTWVPAKDLGFMYWAGKAALASTAFVKKVGTNYYEAPGFIYAL